MAPDFPLKLAEVVDASAAVAATRSRKEKTSLLAGVVARFEPEERAAGIAYLSGRPLQDRLGVGWAGVRKAVVDPAPEATLTLNDVDDALGEIADASGAGSTARRESLLMGLMAAATADEQDFLQRLLLRDLRQGATEGVMIEAIAKASGAPAGSVRRGAMVTGSIVVAGEVALRDGRPGLEALSLRVLTPIQPMLASTAPDLATALDGREQVAVDAKLDGARVQVHRDGATVRVFTRNLRDITDQVPEVVAAVAALPVTSVILDGEVIALRDDGRPYPFQVTMGRFGREIDRDDSGDELPVTPFFFDILHLDGEDLLDAAAVDRYEHLGALPSSLIVDRITTGSVDEARRFADEILAAGHEGVVVKSLDAPYAAGRRGSAWLKVKPVHTLDLVILAVEWGSGRRRGWLSNLHLGARDAAGGFVMLGKTFKGLTDEMLEWQTKRLLELETHREGHIVHVRPELVAEIAFDGVQSSPRYPGGLALRFARVKGHRPDKAAGDADTIDTVRAIFEGAR